MTRKDWSQHGLIALLPFLAEVLVFMTEASARNFFFVCAPGGCESIPQNIWKVLPFDAPSADISNSDAGRELIALRYSGRMAWYFIAEVFLYVCAGVMILSFFFVFQSSLRPRVVWTSGLVVLSSLVGMFFYNHPEIHMAIFQTIFEKAITGDMPAISQATRFLNSIANAAIFLLLMAACVVLVPSSVDSVPEGMKQLSAGAKRLRLILYAGTILLVTAMLLKKAVYQWTLAYIPQGDFLDTAQNFVTSLLTIEGGFYTLVLAASYVPAALVLQRRALLLVDGAVDEAAREAKLKEFGLNLSFKETLPRVLAILGPFLTGPLGDLLNLNFF